MEEIIIKDENNREQYDIVIKNNENSGLISIEDYTDIISVTANEARQLADAIYKLLGIDLERQAFEAGREVAMDRFDVKYLTFEDYNQSLKHKDNGNKGE